GDVAHRARAEALEDGPAEVGAAAQKAGARHETELPGELDAASEALLEAQRIELQKACGLFVADAGGAQARLVGAAGAVLPVGGIRVDFGEGRFEGETKAAEARSARRVQRVGCEGEAE